MVYILSDIMWDKEVDNNLQEVDLPTCMEVDSENEEDALDVASDRTGYCI